jgi:hypothetical protein
LLTSKARDLRFRGGRVLAIVVVLSCLVPLLATAKSGALVPSNGGILAYGDAASYGSTGSLSLNKGIVGMAATPDGKGYWLVAADGGIFAYGDATFYGSTGGLNLNRPMVGMAGTPDGRGYWLVASDGGIFSYGDATFFGSRGSLPLNRPVVGLATTHDGKGYWLVASDGGIFSYGDAAFDGSTGSRMLNRPVVGMAGTPDGKGYWLVASDGGIFSYGDAAFDGSTGSLTLNRPVVGMAGTPDGKGYWLVASDGGIFTYGDAAFFGSTGGLSLNNNIVGMAGTPDGKGYWMAASDGGISAPPGYTAQQMIFDDRFAGTSLDTSKWTTSLGASGLVWNNFGRLASPYTGPNAPITDEAAMFGPSQVSVANGLALTATRNPNGYAGTYPWLSGVVTTEGKFSLPTSGWYVQVKAKMPDQSRGMWPAIWFLPGVSGTPSNELDSYEGGWIGANPNAIMHSDYFANQGQQQQAYSVGQDVTAGYHIYGFQFIPGQSITAYFDGNQVWQVSASSGVTITGEPYEIILQLEVAAQQTSGWHTLTSGATPPASMDVAEVQAYS